MRWIFVVAVLALAGCGGRDASAPPGPGPNATHYTGETAGGQNFVQIAFAQPMSDMNYRATYQELSHTGNPVATAREFNSWDKTANHVTLIMASGPGDGSTITWDIAIEPQP